MGTWLRSRIASRLGVLKLVHGPRDVLFMLRVLCFASSVPILMRQPLAKVERLVELGHAPRPPREPERVQRVVEMVLAVLQAGRPLIRRGCLTRGMTLYHFLRCEGCDVHLYFGIGNAKGSADVFGDGFDGHCWLVQDGAPLLEARDPRQLYTIMWRIPSGAATAQTAQTVQVRANAETLSI